MQPPVSISGSPARPARPVLKFALRVLVLALVAAAIGWLLNHTASRLDQDAAPAGFGRGMLHGALMPMTAPHLLLGVDLPIYSERNTGRLYKVGYTLGVNLCGTVFFGFFYWRLNRWREAIVRQQREAAPSSRPEEVVAG